MSHKSPINVVQKIWREIKRPFRKLYGKKYRDENQISQKIQVDKDFRECRLHLHSYANLANTIAKDKKVLFVDIGGNEAQSARIANKFFPNCRIISYEPLKSCINILKSYSRDHDNFQFFNVAMSDTKGNVKIYENRLSGLSSMLELDKTYKYFPNIGLDTQIYQIYEVPTTTILDEVSMWDSTVFGWGETKILKIDTQGTELKILMPAKQLLEDGYFDAVVIEVMTKQKYIGQQNWTETMRFFDDCSFEVFSILSVCRDNRDISVSPWSFDYGQDTEFDFVFVHKNRIREYNKFKVD